nr:META domain-containing protein [uncultured Methanoregula sp.]
MTGEHGPDPEDSDYAYDPNDAEDDPDADNPCRESQKPGLYLYIAIALLGCAVLLVVILNIPAIQASAGTTLTTTPWQLSSLANPGGNLSPANQGIVARFGRDGRLGGNAGCNDYSATYTTYNYAIEISPPVTSLKSCPAPGVMDNETLYLQNLAIAKEFRVNAGQLRLYDRNGTPLLAFVSAES